jgi:hypothetical protein
MPRDAANSITHYSFMGSQGRRYMRVAVERDERDERMSASTLTTTQTCATREQRLPERRTTGIKYDYYD